jgi:hypothetical protein
VQAEPYGASRGEDHLLDVDALGHVQGNRDSGSAMAREPGQVMTPAILPPILPVGRATCRAAALHVLTGAGVWGRASRRPGGIIRMPGCRAGSQVGYSRHPVQDRCQDCLVGVQ